MGYRKISLAAALFLVIAGAAWLTIPVPLRDGAAAPVLPSATTPKPDEIVWVFKAEDILRCETAAYALRRVRAMESAPPLRLVLVGSGEGLIHDYLRGERLDADMIQLSAWEYRRRYGRTRLPALYIAHESRVVHVWAGIESVGETTRGDRPLLLGYL